MLLANQSVCACLCLLVATEPWGLRHEDEEQSQDLISKAALRSTERDEHRVRPMCHYKLLPGRNITHRSCRNIAEDSTVACRVKTDPARSADVWGRVKVQVDPPPVHTAAVEEGSWGTRWPEAASQAHAGPEEWQQDKFAGSGWAR